MEKLLKLKQAREQALATASTAFAKAVNGVLATADQIAFDTAMAEADRLDGEITTEQAAQDLAANNVARIERARASAGPRSLATATATGTPAAVPTTIVTSQRDLTQTDPRRGFRSQGEFATAVMQAMSGAHSVDPRLAPLGSITGMGQTVGADGGFLVPPEFSNQIWDGLNSAPENLLNRCDQYTVQGESLSFPAVNETSRADGSRSGGVRGYWLAEGGQVTTSKPTFRMVKVEPHQLGVLIYVTDKLIKNSPVALEQYLTRCASNEISFKVSDAIVNGTGVGMPKGILASGATVSVAKENAQAATTVVAANIAKMWARIHPNAENNAIWLINKEVEAQLELLTMTVGTGGVPIYLPPGGFADAPNARLKGRPVIKSEFCAALGTVGDIILCDLKSYLAGVRGGIESAMSMHLRFDYAESAFRFLYEVDGQPWNASPITPFKGSATLSPFVSLATRG